MTVEWRLLPAVPDGCAVVVPAFAGVPSGVAPQAFLDACGFGGEVGEVVQLPGSDGEPARVMLGLGPAHEVDADAIRRAAACLARAVRGHHTLAITMSATDRVPPRTQLRAVVEGFMLGGYRFDKYKAGKADHGPARIDVIAPDSADLRAGLRTGRRMSDAVLLARDLVNEPGEELTPAIFAERAWRMAAESGLGCEVWDEARITAERLGGLLAVSRGSPRPPRLVRLSYEPEGPTASVALVGKGVTFDAGGISLKPNAQMVDMKADMAGAAVVLGAMSVLADLGCPVRVDGWLPLTENMPNADPIRIGDVLRIRDGTTVEVRNADAEGRLIMADALVLAGEAGPDAIVDVATLTDAAAVALGRKIAAVMGNDDGLVEALRRAAARAGEPVWPLPLPRAYRPQLDSAVADLVNYTIGVRHGTALLAGLFLREFVPAGIAWAHLDVQGTSVCDTVDGEWVAGGTGFGVRTLAELLASYPDP